MFSPRTINVRAEDVIITSTMDSSIGLTVNFYVKLVTGDRVLPRSALDQSVQVGLFKFDYSHLKHLSIKYVIKINFAVKFYTNHV